MAVAVRTLTRGARWGMRPLVQPPLGQKLSELRQRYRWSQNALADKSDVEIPTIRSIEDGYGPREMKKWKEDPSYEPRPYETSPKVLRKLAHALADGRADQEKEAIYGELMEAAGWLPQVPRERHVPGAAERLEQMQERYLALSRAMEECERILHEASA